jgi:hypothetical protein
MRVAFGSDCVLCRMRRIGYREVAASQFERIRHGIGCRHDRDLPHQFHFELQAFGIGVSDDGHRQDESCAMEESMAPYRIGMHKTKEPLPAHLLIADDEEADHGLHWSSTNL